MTALRIGRALRLLILLTLLAPASLSAQDALGGLLTRAKNALNDLKYSEADSLARLLIALGDVVPRPQRIAALQIAAAARYPDDKPLQRADSAVSALKVIVLLGHTDPIPFEIGWAGLDSLFRSVGGAAQLPPDQRTATAVDPNTGPSLTETAQWLNERVPEFVGLSWKDESPTVGVSVSQRVSGIDIRPCTIKYRIVHNEDEVWYKERNRRNNMKWDSAYVFDAKTLNPATVQGGSADIRMRLFGMLRGTTKSDVGYVKVTEKAVAGQQPRTLDLTLTTPAQAARVRSALMRFIQLCQRELF